MKVRGNSTAVAQSHGYISPSVVPISKISIEFYEHAAGNLLGSLRSTAVSIS